MRNKAVRSSLKTATKKVTTAAAASGDAEATQRRPSARPRGRSTRPRPRASLHKRTAARHKSRLAKAANRAAAVGRDRRYTGRVGGSPAIAATSIGSTTSSVAPDFSARSAHATRSWRPASSSRREALGLLAVAPDLPVEPESGLPRRLGRREPLGQRPHADQVAEPRRDRAEDHQPRLAGLEQRPERTHRAREVARERPVAQVPDVLLAEPAELPRDDLARDPLARERRRELVERLFERPGVLAERVDERRRAVGREVELLRLRPLEHPAGKLLARDLDLGHRPDALDELHERRRRLRAIADHRDQHERRVGVGRLQVAAQLADALVGQRLRVRDQERPPLAEQRRRREVPRLAALPQRRRPPRPAGGRRGARARPRAGGTRPRPTGGAPARPSRLRAHAADSTTTPPPSKVTVTVPGEVGPQHAGTGRADPVEDLGDGVAVGVRTDADDGDLRADGLEERFDRGRGAVVRHLEDVGVQVHALVEQHLLRRLLGFGREQDRVLPEARADDDRVVVRVGLGPGPAAVRRQDLEADVAHLEHVARPRVPDHDVLRGRGLVERGPVR